MVARHRLNPAQNQAIRRAAAGMPPGAIAAYDFHEGAGQVLTDLSGHGNNGQLGSTSGVDANDPTWSGGGLKPDGVDDLVTLPFGTSGPLSFLLVTDPTQSAAHQSLVDRYHPFIGNSANGNEITLQWRTYTSEPGAGYFLRVNWFSATNGAQDLLYTLPARVTAPVMLTVTIDADTATLYMGATAVGQKASLGGQRASGALQLFRSMTTSGEMPLYYLRVWNRALSGAEVQRAYRIIKAQMAAQKGITI